MRGIFIFINLGEMPFGGYHFKYTFNALYNGIALNCCFICLAKAPFPFEYNPSSKPEIRNITLNMGGLFCCNKRGNIHNSSARIRIPPIR